MTEFHPLFPPGDDDDDSDESPPDIQEILIQRKEDGKWVSGPRTFMPSELSGQSQLHAEFGVASINSLLAIAFIMGLAANDLIKALVDDIIMPVITFFIPGGSWKTATFSISRTYFSTPVKMMPRMKNRCARKKRVTGSTNPRREVA
jgi:hypothetical protein